jgi:catechol 2,3-dioxygenase-like lactoylglutathione lyase family enzyme
MQQSVCNVSLLVDDYDKGIEFYTKTLGFTLLDDIENSPDSRWVRVAPNNKAGQSGAALISSSGLAIKPVAACLFSYKPMTFIVIIKVCCNAA